MESNQNEHRKKLEKEIAELYTAHIHRFVNTFRSYGIENCKDAFQEAMIAVFTLLKGDRKTKKGEIKNIVSLLFTIGRNKLVDNSNKGNKEALAISEKEKDNSLYSLAMDLDIFETNDRVEKLRVAFKKLGGKCQEIISLRYFEGIRLEEIVDIMGYSSYDVAKQRFHVCMTDLRKNFDT